MLLYIVNDTYKHLYGSQYITTNNDKLIRGLAMASDYVVKFTKDKPHFFIKNKFTPNFRDPYTHKELAWMLLKAKNYDTINL